MFDPSWNSAMHQIGKEQERQAARCPVPLPETSYEPLPQIGIAYNQQTGAVLCVWRGDDGKLPPSVDVIQYVPESALADLRSKLDRMREVIAAHRRFHSKAGCPGRPECYVCAEEEWMELHERQEPNDANA